MGYLLLSLLEIALLSRYGYSGFVVPFVSPETCGNSEFFDSARLRCRTCNDEEQQAKQQRRNANGLSCECLPNHRIVSLKNGIPICEPCSLNEVTSSDGWQCLQCSASHPFSNVTQSCAPCEDGVVRESLELEKQCLPCNDYTRPDVTGKRCIRCPEDQILASNGSCECQLDKFTLSGGICIPNTHILSDGTWSVLTLESGQQVKSEILQEHLQAVIYQCKALHNITACQMLSNLCVLTLYKMGSSKGNSFVCDEYLKIATQESLKPVQWLDGFPRLFYNEGDAQLELSKTNVPNKFSLNTKSELSALKFVAATYSLQGAFLGLHNITIDALQLCKTSSEDIEKGFIFGAQYQISCKLPVQKIWDVSKMVFFELYLLHAKEDKMEMYPVPILVKNLQKNDESINRGKKQSKWQLTRRFFLADPISGIEIGNTLNLPQAKALHYIENFHIRIRVRDEEDGEDTGSIYPPLVVINYAEATREDLFRNAHVVTYFTVTYDMAQSKTFSSIVVSLAVLSVLSIIWSLFQTWGWARRAGKINIDIQSLGKLLVFASGNLANVFFLIVLCASLNWLIIFKRQDVVHLLLPTPEQESSFLVYVSAAFGLKLLQVIHLLVSQSTIDIFFIDWERPRIGHRGVPPRRSSVRTVDETSIQGSEGGNLPGIGTGKHQIAEKFIEGGGVSIWRTYFVASAWADLQTLRRVRPSLQLFILLCFLKVIGFENLSLSDPHGSFDVSDKQRYTPFSATCRFAIGASLFLLIALIQYIIHRVVFERFFEDKLQQFIDLCSVSNISVFIMSLPRYGYYIHGRSAHGRSDVNMKEMHEHLRQEEEDLCGHRGLLPNTEQQTFCLSLPESVGDQYKRLLLPLTSYSQTADRMQGVGGKLALVDIDRVVNSYVMVNKFLSGFIEHAFKDLDYAVKDKFLMENLLDVEFSEVQDRGFFYNDNSHSFDSVLFCGQESSLVIFEALLFSLVDLSTQDYVLAAIFTYLFCKVIEAVRKSAGRRNLVRKALVDERFLNV